MHAIRARRIFDGETFRDVGATVVVEDGLILGVELYGHQLPEDCPVTSCEGTLLPGLIEMHTHLVIDSAVSALDRVASYSEEEIDHVITKHCAINSLGCDYRARPGGSRLRLGRAP